MNIGLDRLHALRRQAGAATVASPRARLSEPAGSASTGKIPTALVAEPATAHDARSPRSAALAADTLLPTPRVHGSGTEIAIDPVERGKRDVAALRRLLDLRERTVAPTTAAPRRSSGAALDRDLPGVEIASGLHLIESFLPQPIPRTLLSLAFARREDAVDPANLLFFDTETTGLAGGTGTRAFMIGAADWTLHPANGPGLRIRQLLMATMRAEKAMLETFSTWLTPTTVLSSYNGRSYDAPLLKTRYRLARCADPLSALDHVDLLHPTRRRYRGTWENCKLATIERQLLRIVREDDLPGSQAPAAWLHYLRGGSARDLRRVAAHNHQDVATLALLLQRLVAAEAQAQADRALP